MSDPEKKPEEHAKAYWHYYLGEDGKTHWQCTNCKRVKDRYPMDKYYCSKCGADMSFER